MFKKIPLMHMAAGLCPDLSGDLEMLSDHPLSWEGGYSLRSPTASPI